MSITKWTDAYATVEEIDLLMSSNKEWQALTETVKEDYIKAAANAIDTHFLPDGGKVSDSQPLNFPRDFGGAKTELFDETAQERNLRRATFWQCIQYMKDTCFGLAEVQESSKRTFPTSLLNDNAYIVLKIYKYEGMLV